MTELLGPLVLLGVLLWVLRSMVIGRWHLRSSREARRYERRPRQWWRAARWVPAGYALTKILGEGTPILVVLVLAVLLAVVFRAVPGPFQLVVGGGALAISIVEAVRGTDCQPPLGRHGIVLLVVFGTVAAIATLTSGIGAGRLASGEYLVAMTSAVELVFFAIRPSGAEMLDLGRSPVASFLLATVLVAFLVGLRPRVGLATLGGGIIVAEASLAFVGGPCDRAALAALAGSLLFAATRLLLSRRSVRRRIGLR